MTGFIAPPSTTDSTTPLFQMRTMVELLSPLGGIYQGLRSKRFLDYAMAVANDEDGYEGIQFCKYIADIMGNDDTIDWNNFI